ncbi:universal stress protein [Polaromonas sp. CG_9.11]|uniref:universal stress protein n=1 Tax=Polaromonas sp. CG_9.11 TaxID=2787730 RepID=UPI0009DE1DB6
MHVNAASRKPGPTGLHKAQPMYQRILVPVDESGSASKKLVAALQMARESGGRVRLIHGVEQLAYLTGYKQFGGSSARWFGHARSRRQGARRCHGDGPVGRQRCRQPEPVYHRRLKPPAPAHRLSHSPLHTAIYKHLHAKTPE